MSHLIAGAPPIRTHGYAEAAQVIRKAQRGMLPSDFAVRALHRDGKAYDMYRRKHLAPVYNEPGDMLKQKGITVSFWQKHQAGRRSCMSLALYTTSKTSWTCL